MPRRSRSWRPPISVVLVLGFGVLVAGAVVAVLLLALGSVVSLYLGLLMTRGLGWLETVLGIGTMGMLIATAASIGLKAPDLLTASALEGVLAVDRRLVEMGQVYRFSRGPGWRPTVRRTGRRPQAQLFTPSHFQDG